MILVSSVVAADPVIQTIVKPRLSYTVVPCRPYDGNIELQAIKDRLVKKYEVSDTSLLQKELQLLEYRPSVELQKTVEVLEEIYCGSYSYEEALTYVHWVTRLYLHHLLAGVSEQTDQVIDACKRFEQSDFSLIRRSEAECGHSPAWNLCDRKTGAVFAILKESVIVPLPDSIKRQHLLCFSSFLRHLPDMPLTSKINDHELMGYEMDLLFGLDRTPLTCKATFLLGENSRHEGVVQLFAHNTKPFFSHFFEKKGKAVELLAIPKAKVHLTAFSGIFKGLMAHHISNYLVRLEDGRPCDIVEIDLEESMPPYNRAPKKSIVLGRLAILGLPQAKAALDRALLLIACHPSWNALLEAYHGACMEKRVLHPDSLQAQKERLQYIQKRCSEALVAKSSFTVRELYFEIFGGKELYALAKEKGYADITAFNNVVSDPYQHVIKDFDHPEQMKASSALLPPKKRTSRLDKIKQENLQILEAH